MGFAHLDQFAHGGSWLERHTTPAQRLYLGLAAALTAALLPSGAWVAFLGLAVAVWAGARGLPATVYLRRLSHALPFFLLPLIALPLAVPGPIAIAVGPLELTEPGLVRAGEIGLRGGLAIAAMTVVLSVTRAADLVDAIYRLPVPRIVATSLALGYRYLYTLVDEHERARRALQSRDVSGGRCWAARTAVMAHLLYRAHARGLRVHGAMLSRGFRDRLPTLDHHPGSLPWTLVILCGMAGLWVLALIEVAP